MTTSPIGKLFDDIAPRYDFLNHILSFNIDKIWRKKSLKNKLPNNAGEVLDIACGTGDFAFELIKCKAQKVIGIDISEQMVALGRKKTAEKNLTDRIDLQVGDCANLPFDDNRFDAITVAFGVRNFEQRAICLQQMYRVLKQNGTAIILEFSTPKSFPIKQIYSIYFRFLLPAIGGIVSGNKAAYAYLPNSVYAFPQGNDFLIELQNAGFGQCSFRRMTFGIVSVYYGTKL